MPFESRKRLRDQKQAALLQTAVRLFLERGYYRTTLDDVADQLNITKPALYNYFRSKEEILFACWMFGQEQLDDAIEAIEGSAGKGLEKLRDLIRAYATLMTTDFGAGLIRFDVRDLSEEHRNIVLPARKKADATFRKYVREGIADGSIRECDVKMSAFAIAGALNWIGFWYQADGEMSPEAIADEFSIRLTDGLAARRSQSRKRS
ncbi:MAG: TetR/AcrR family transcriptional regulator [Filomicrobium sp.]